MATTEIIADGSTEASSADRTIEAGVTETILMRTSSNDSICLVEAKGSDAAYYEIGRLGTEGRVKQIDGPFVYRVRRLAGGACAVDIVT